MMDLFNLTGKVAVVTGTNRGIGQDIAIGLAEAGADIALIQRNTNDLQTKHQIEELGQKVEVFQCDLANADEIRKVIPKIIQSFGNIDILVNNAGIQRRNPSELFTEQDWDDVLNINLKSTFLLSQEVGRIMLQQGKGKIINIASLLSFQGGINVPAYAAAKGGVAQLTKALSNEWASKGINVNAIAPGYIATDMNEALLHNETRNRQILERIPAGRWGNAEDFKGSVIYLASKASDYVHGHVLVVDGGWMGR